MYTSIKSLALLAITTAPQLATAANVRMFANADCDSSGYYSDFSASENECGKVYFTDSDYKQDSGDPSSYDVYLEVTDGPGDGCAFVMARDSTDAQGPPCGECIGQFQTVNKCFYLTVPDVVYLNVCCGGDCQTECGGTPGKRSINETVHEVAAKRHNPAELKSTNPFATEKRKAKRDDCTFTPTGGLFSSAGDAIPVSDTFQPCPNDQGCSESWSGMAESSFSQTFGVSETTEAGFFDIVSESVSFSYSATYESSMSVSVTGMYTFSQGQSGYITFSPLSQCQMGTFSGSGCGDIPTGGDARQACVPEMIQGGQLRGDINVVTTE